MLLPPFSVFVFAALLLASVRASAVACLRACSSFWIMSRLICDRRLDGINVFIPSCGTDTSVHLNGVLPSRVS